MLFGKSGSYRMRFNTVGSDLEAAAAAAVAYFRGRGFAVRAEPYEFDYPRTPTFRCTRGKAKLFVEATAEYRQRTVDDWIAYAKTRDHETAVAILVRTPPGISMEDAAALRAKRVGLLSYADGEITELVPAADLAFNISLPALDGLKMAYRTKLQTCFDKIDRGEWVDGFKDACQVLEETSRELLKDGVRRGRISFIKAGKPILYPIARIGKMPQGQLAQAYAEIQNPTHLDIVLGRALKRVNGARITAVHKAHAAKNIAKMRVQAGQHLWTVVSALRQVK